MPPSCWNVSSKQKPSEVTEAALGSGWIRVGSGDPNLEINPFAAVLLGFEPPLLSGTMAPLPVVKEKEKDVPSGPGDVFSGATSSKAPKTFGPTPAQAAKEADNRARSRKKRQNKQSSLEGSVTFTPEFFEEASSASSVPPASVPPSIPEAARRPAAVPPNPAGLDAFGPNPKRRKGTNPAFSWYQGEHVNQGRARTPPWGVRQPPAPPAAEATSPRANVVLREANQGSGKGSGGRVRSTDNRSERARSASRPANTGARARSTSRGPARQEPSAGRGRAPEPGKPAMTCEWGCGQPLEKDAVHPVASVGGTGTATAQRRSTGSAPSAEPCTAGSAAASRTVVR